MLGLIDYEGPHVDSGTAYEIGFAVAHKKPVILFHQNEHPVNIMLCHTAHYYCKKFEDLINYDFVNRPANKYEGKIFWSSTLYLVISESEEPKFFSHTMKRRVLKYTIEINKCTSYFRFRIVWWCALHGGKKWAHPFPPASILSSGSATWSTPQHFALFWHSLTHISY